MSQFTKPIREAVRVWADTFNPEELCKRIEATFRQELEQKVRERTRELEAATKASQDTAKAHQAAVDGLKARITTLEREKADEKRIMSTRYAELKERYDDLETRQNAVIRSAQVAV